MFPNLFQATQEYWRKLDALEAKYQRNEISIQEVDAQVEKLMAELGAERRRSLKVATDMLQNWLVTQKESFRNFGDRLNLLRLAFGRAIYLAFTKHLD